MVMDNSSDCGDGEGWVEVEEAMEGLNSDGKRKILF